MQTSEVHQRLDGLDWLKGVAALLVVLTHIPVNVLLDGHPYLFTVISLPFIWGHLGNALFLGVTAFLLVYKYKNEPTGQDATRHFDRLLPLFLAVVAGNAVSQLWLGQREPLVILGVVALLLMLQKHFRYWNTSFFVWLRLHYFWFIAIAAGLLVLLTRMVPAPVFYSAWPTFWQQLVQLGANASLSFPFTQYVSQYEGVFWYLSLLLTIYLLRRSILVPVSYLLAKQKGAKLFLGIVILLMAGWAWGWLFHLLFNFHMIKIWYWPIVILGGWLGAKYKQQESLLPFSAVGTGAIIVGGLALLRWVLPLHGEWHWLHYSLLFVIAALVIALVVEKFPHWHWPIINKWGSYAIIVFLLHPLIIDILEPLHHTAWSQFWHVFSSLLWITISIPLLVPLLRSFTCLRFEGALVGHSQPKPLLVLGSFWLLGSLLAFGYSGSTLSQAQFVRSAQPWLEQQLLIEPITIPFTAKANNLGMIVLDIAKHAQDTSGMETIDNAELQIKMYDDANNLVTEFSTLMAHVHDGRQLPIGLPLQPNSQGRKYSVQIGLSGLPAKEYIVLRQREQVISARYYHSLASLSASDLWQMLLTRFSSWLANPYWWFLSALAMPSFFMIWRGRAELSRLTIS